MRRLLAIDSSADECSLAIWSDCAIVGHRELPARQASELLVRHIDELLDVCKLDRNQLTGLVVGIGPGAFTGVRLALATAQGLGLALNIPIFPISSLAAVAWAAGSVADDSLPILSMLDARMDEVYAGWYARDDNGGIVPISSTVVTAPSLLARPAGISRFRVAGTGYAPYRERVDVALGLPDAVSPHVPLAIAMAELAACLPNSAGLPPERIDPAYVRDKVALTSIEQQALRDAKQLPTQSG